MKSLSVFSILLATVAIAGQPGVNVQVNTPCVDCPPAVQTQTYDWQQRQRTVQVPEYYTVEEEYQVTEYIPQTVTKTRQVQKMRCVDKVITEMVPVAVNTCVPTTTCVPCQTTTTVAANCNTCYTGVNVSTGLFGTNVNVNTPFADRPGLLGRVRDNLRECLIRKLIQRRVPNDPPAMPAPIPVPTPTPTPDPVPTPTPDPTPVPPSVLGARL